MAEKQNIPEIRFEGFTDPWEQRKFSDLVLIERGGSPRPIDAYITEDPAGLNWVKIGDAPSMGRYITSTSEKIKLEGLSKTRQVYPGDLVLSNSMSFGRPYIMAVEGCIHDGWLLIRDTQNQFDPVFLCHMLGTPQMLDQYRMFASGSTVNNLNKELVGNAMVPLPNRDEQVKIGKYLDELDGLITLHQRKCQYRSLYGYLSWEQRKFSEIVDVCSGRDYKHLNEGPIPVYGTGGYMTSVCEALSHNRDAVGIGRKGTIDKPYLLKAPFWTVDTLFYAIPKPDINLEFALCSFLNVDWKSKDESTGLPSLSKEAINETVLRVPNAVEQNHLGSFFTDIDSLITLHQ